MINNTEKTHIKKPEENPSRAKYVAYHELYSCLYIYVGWLGIVDSTSMLIYKLDVF